MRQTRSGSAATDSSVSATTLRDYVEAAVRHARVEQMEDGRCFATVAELQGVWADGDDPSACLRTLREVLLDWTLLKLQRGDRDFPEIEGIRLTSV